GGGVQRPLKFARHLQGLGFQPTVLAPEIDLRRFTLDSTLLEEAGDLVCHRVPTPGLWSDRLPGTLRRAVERGFGTPLPDRLVAAQSAFVARALELHRGTPFQIVLTTSPPHSLALLGLRLKETLGIPWVADFRDEWSRNRLRTGRMSAA